jgi:hypothetical protein
MIDESSKRKLTLLNAMLAEKAVGQSDLSVGQLTITP